jgi:hypothetical protein
MVVVLAGCADHASPGSGDSGSDGTAAISGSISGSPLQVDDAIAAVEEDIDGDASTMIVLMSGVDACGDVGGQIAANATQVSLSIAVLDSTQSHYAAVTAPGTFSISSDGAVDAQVDRYDAACQRVATSSNRASTGSITVDSVSSTGYVGHFAMTLETGDSITGTFTAPICDSLTQVLDADRALGTCTP